MRKTDLRNGDIVVTRDGSLGVVILDENNEKILFQLDGMDSLENYSDDLQNDFLGMTELDVMEIHHDACFLDFMLGEPVPDIIRENGWHRPDEEEKKKLFEHADEFREEEVEDLKKRIIEVPVESVTDSTELLSVKKDSLESI